MSYLTEEEQQKLWNIVERQGLKVKPVYAEKLRKASGSLTEEKMAEILEALQVKHTDGNAGVSFKLPKSICSKYFDGMDSQERRNHFIWDRLMACVHITISIFIEHLVVCR